MKLGDRIITGLLISFVVYITVAHYCDFKRSLGLPTTHCTVQCS